MPKLRARAALVAAAAATTIAMAPTGAANAAIPMCPTDNFCMYEYFATSDMTESVGRTYVECDGSRSTVGEITRHIQLYTSPCPW